mgnify:CR=1 FL=1
MDEPVKKKRGRKPKSLTQTGEQNNETNKTEQKVKKKRGRKPKQVFIMDQN